MARAFKPEPCLVPALKDAFSRQGCAATIVYGTGLFFHLKAGTRIKVEQVLFCFLRLETPGTYFYLFCAAIAD